MENNQNKLKLNCRLQCDLCRKEFIHLINCFIKECLEI